MSIFYDPKKKQVQPWVYVPFIVIPIILFTAVILWGKSKGGINKMELKQKEDVFNKF